MNGKASTGLYLKCLKRAGFSPSELETIYIAIVRTVLEYACPVWAKGLNGELSRILDPFR